MKGRKIRYSRDITSSAGKRGVQIRNYDIDGIVDSGRFGTEPKWLGRSWQLYICVAYAIKRDICHPSHPSLLPKMISPRMNEQRDGPQANCPPGYINCSATIITGTDEGNNSSRVTGPPGYEKPGPHRYIGIGMAVGMFFIVFVLWLSLAKWPRRMAKTYCCCSRRKAGLEIESGEESIKNGEEKVSNDRIGERKVRVEEYTMVWTSHVRRPLTNSIIR